MDSITEKLQNDSNTSLNHHITATSSEIPSTKAGSSISTTTFATTLGNTNCMLVFSDNYQMQSMASAKKEDFNNTSLASAVSEGQRSFSGAASTSSSPISSPPVKFFGRNTNGTMVSTSRPSNEAEVQLYRVLQRASLLVYFDTLVEMGGDDVLQLYEAGEEEFLEIMALVGMASKPLHVRRLQKALHEWANNPSLFQGPITSNTTTGFCDTKKTSDILNYETSTASLPRCKRSTFNPTPAFNPTPLISTFSQMCTPAVIQPHTSLALSTLPSMSGSIALYPTHPSSGNSTSHHVSSSSPQLTPVLTEIQVSRITIGAEKVAAQLPQREPRAHTSKKRTNRELEQVIAMTETNPRRMDEIRKYSAIYGRFDCKRRPEKPLTLHEVCVNEAAAQLCQLVPALLTRRDELFPMARQIVKDAGFGHSAGIARYGGLLTQMQAQVATQCSSAVADCESSDSVIPPKRHRVLSTDITLSPSLGLNRDSKEDTRFSLFAMYQKFAKQTFDLSDNVKNSLNKDEQDDSDSQFSFSSSSSPFMIKKKKFKIECDDDHFTFGGEHQNCLMEETKKEPKLFEFNNSTYGYEEVISTVETT